MANYRFKNILVSILLVSSITPLKADVRTAEVLPTHTIEENLLLNTGLSAELRSAFASPLVKSFRGNDDNIIINIYSKNASDGWTQDSWAQSAHPGQTTSAGATKGFFSGFGIAVCYSLSAFLAHAADRAGYADQGILFTYSLLFGFAGTAISWFSFKNFLAPYLDKDPVQREPLLRISKHGIIVKTAVDPISPFKPKTIVYPWHAVLAKPLAYKAHGANYLVLTEEVLATINPFTDQNKLPIPQALGWIAVDDLPITLEELYALMNFVKSKVK